MTNQTPSVPVLANHLGKTRKGRFPHKFTGDLEQCYKPRVATCPLLQVRRDQAVHCTSAAETLEKGESAKSCCRPGDRDPLVCPRPALVPLKQSAHQVSLDWYESKIRSAL